MKTCLLNAVAGLLLAAGASQTMAGDAGTETNPYSPAFHHPYRHGVMPTITVRAAMLRWQKEHPLTTNPKTLAFGGGTGGVGVNSGISKVYLVFYGSQWGTSSTDANGNLQFSADTAGAAGAAQQMFKGIGTNGEKWSAELTQWCDGTGVSLGATICPASGANYVPYQQKVLAGVWYDNASASPPAATQVQLANEAIRAAAHFDNETALANANTYYVILSPTGTNPDSYEGNFCSWHGDTVEAGGSTDYGDLAFSNQPYNLDEGAECGQNFVNSGSAGTLDGYTITLGQQWQGMMADTLPAGGWTNHGTGTYAGEENSQECQWIAPGSPGGAANVKFNTGTFAEQSNWSNDTHDCAITHTIVFRNEPPTANFTYTNSGAKGSFTDGSTDVDGTIVSHAWNFYDFGTSTLANPTHTYTDDCLYPITETVTDNNGLSASITHYIGPLGTVAQICNSSFEVPPTFFEEAFDWGGSSDYQSIACPTGCGGESAHTGSGFALFNGGSDNQKQWLGTSLPIYPGTAKATLTYWLHIDTRETTTTDKIDTLAVQLFDSGGNYVKTLQVYSNLGASSGYQQHNNDVTNYVQGPMGYSIRFLYTHSNETTLNTSFVLDDVTVSAQ